MGTLAPVRLPVPPRVRSLRRWSVRPTLHRRARLDMLFDRVLLSFRRSLVAAMDHEPPGPARHLRAYLRCVCAYALAQPGRQHTVAWLLLDAENRAIWRDLVDEGCADDLLHDDLSRHCRCAVEQLWLAQVLWVPCSADEITAARDRLLSLCDAPARAP